MPDAKPMTPERLAEIERLLGDWPYRIGSPQAASEGYAAIPELLAEVRRLEAGPGWAELRAARRLNDAGAKAIDALELIQESARDRIAALEAGLREAVTQLESHYEDQRCSGDPIVDPDNIRLRALADGVHYDKEPHDPA